MVDPQEQNDPLFSKTMLIPSKRTSIHMVETFVESLLELITIRDAIFDNIMISLTEAVNNGIIHGNHSDPEKNVHLTCRCFPNILEFVIQDEGRGFNPAEIPDPFHEDNLLKEGGRGVLIIHAMMEDVRYEKTPEGMRITMRIRR